MDSEEIYKQAILFRRWLHRHPEVSTQEFQTQAFVIDVLKEYKIPYKTYGTGIIATLGEGADCVALRADMDALRVQEDTGLPYCSEIPGLMHACGHDMHTAMLLGAAIIFKSKESELGGTLKLVFQPSEEKWDFSLEAGVADLHALEVYANHPAHQEIVKTLIAPVKVDRACVDYRF